MKSRIYATPAVKGLMSANFITLDKHAPLNPLSPHDALKHHFTFLKTYLILLQPRVLE